MEPRDPDPGTPSPRGTRDRLPPVHLWIYNHPFHGITDQTEFFLMALGQHGYAVSIGQQPRASSLNVVIEDFTARAAGTLVEFCRAHRKRVAVIMTEHLDFVGDRIFIHGEPLWSHNDYMHPVTQINRIRHLLDCLPHVRCFLVLGDLPELRNISTMAPGVAVRSIPFPELPGDRHDRGGAPASPVHDLLFTGFMTEHRSKQLGLLRQHGLSVHSPERFVSRRRRHVLTREAKLVLNLPQREGWRWLSLMRVFAALASGRASVSVGTSDRSRIAACCPQIDLERDDWPQRLAVHAAAWQDLHRSTRESYTCMVREFESERGFPHDLFEYWAITDRVRP